jgi:hypothetical protein
MREPRGVGIKMQSLPRLEDHNAWADFWRYRIGVNVIPAISRNKRPSVTWAEYQDKPIDEELHNKWKSEHKFSKGIAVILAKVWHRKDKLGYYLAVVDADNAIATQEMSVSAKTTLVEQHKDSPDKTHSYLYSPRPIKKKSSDIRMTNTDLTKRLCDNEIPAVEIKCEGSIMFCTPSVHKNGYRYEFIGADEPITLVLEQANNFEKHIDSICRKHGLKYLEAANGNNKVPIHDLFKQDTKVYEGHNRHEALLRVAESLITRNAGILPLGQIKSLSRTWNNDHCIPPIDDKEFEKQWKCAIRFIASRTKTVEGSKENADGNGDARGREGEQKEAIGNGHGYASSKEQRRTAETVFCPLEIVGRNRLTECACVSGAKHIGHQRSGC